VKRTGIIFLLLLTSSCSKADPQSVPLGSSPVEITRAFFAPGGIKNKEELYIGEMKSEFIGRPTLGQYLKSPRSLGFREMFRTKEKAMVAVEAGSGDPSDRELDYYIYLESAKGKWKLAAVRTLWLPGVFDMAIQELEKKGRNRTKEENWQLENSKLTIKSDKFLKGYLRDNLEKFDRMFELHEAGKQKEEAEVAKKLLLGPGENGRFGFGKGVTAFLIGGMIDNEVGYLYIPEGMLLPTMGPGFLIYLERIEGNWFLYKTT
jgi:hypothetical protein